MTALLVPLTSCSARLTVYVLITSIFFPAHAGTVVFGMYVASIVLVVLVGLLLKRTLWHAMGDEPLVLDLPPYQRPAPVLALQSMWVRVRSFLRTATGIILVTVSGVWLLQAIPVRGGVGGFGSVSADDSLYAAIARAITPLFSPAGFADWHMTSALATGFVAKEAVISSWAQTYATTEPGDVHHAGQLGDFIQANFASASGGAVAAAVLAFLVFLLAYTPCVSTLAAQRREIGLRWTAFGVAMQLTVAWTLAVVVFQVGRLVGRLVA
jgi:ferrous iron transport protein B